MFLLAGLRLGEQAYGAPIRPEIENRKQAVFDRMWESLHV